VFDSGFRAHNVNVDPQRPDRAYVGYLDGGAIILDIADVGSPRLVSRLDYHPPMPGFTHTMLPRRAASCWRSATKPLTTTRPTIPSCSGSPTPATRRRR